MTAPNVRILAELLISRFRAGGKLLIAGNGGSAAMAQHMAAELLVRFRVDRDPLPALALTADSAVLTAAANDYAFEHVFERQLHGLGRAGDVLLLLTTSGMSPNLVRAARAAHAMDIFTVAFLGPSAGRLEGLVDMAWTFAAESTGRVQEAHLATIHDVCGEVESLVTTQARPPAPHRPLRVLPGQSPEGSA